MSLSVSSIVLLITIASLATLTIPSTAQDSPQDYVNAHNAARSAVGVGPVTWDPSVAAYAQSYARQRAAGDCKLVHSGGPYGENLAWSSGQLSAGGAVGMWVNERADYDYNSNTCAQGKVCGHYTQVVWGAAPVLGVPRWHAAADVALSSFATTILLAITSVKNLTKRRLLLLVCMHVVLLDAN
ncbi:Pathogenesis-related protein 1 [Linum perenne]